MKLELTWFQLIQSLAVAIGVLLSIALVTIKNRNFQANRILITFILTLCLLMLFQILSGSDSIRSAIGNLGYVFDSVVFLYGPLVYLYTRNLLFKDQGSQKTHFIPALIFLLINVGLVVFDPFNKQLTNVVYVVISITALTHIYGYLIRTLWLTNQYISQSDNYLSVRPSVGYLKSLIFVLLVANLLFTIHFINSFLEPNWLRNILTYNAVWLVVSVTTFLLAYYALHQPELFRLKPEGKSSVIGKADLEILKERLKSVMESEKLYKDHSLSLEDIASRLDIKKRTATLAINKGFNKNFYEFINHYRIEEFLKLMDTDKKEKLTLMAIAHEAGFNSKTTFYKAFKTVKKTHPTDYFKQTHSDMFV